MRKLIFCLLIAISVRHEVVAAESASGKPLEIGVVPYISARMLVKVYEPMRDYLEKALGRPVKIYSAPGFRQFFMNAKRGDYDLVIISGHLARILQNEHHFKVLLRYSSGGRGLVMVSYQSSIKQLQQLQGQVIAVPDALSLASIVCMTYLRENNLKPGKDYTVLEVPSFASAILSIQKGEANAAFSAPGALAQMPQDLRESVVSIANTEEFISQAVLTKPGMSPDFSRYLGNLLLKFGNETEQGRQFMSSTGFGRMLPDADKDLAMMDRYAAESKRLLAEEKSH